jgi:uncharacterized OsmC-like protein
VGEVEKDGKVLVIRHIHVTYRLRGVAFADRHQVERVHGFHARFCPVARSLEDAIAVTTEVVYVD